MSKSCCSFTKCRRCSACFCPINLSGLGLLRPPVTTTARPCGHHLFGRNPLSTHLRPGPLSSPAHPFLLSTLLSLPRPGLQLSSQSGARPAWLAPKRRCFPAAPPPASFQRRGQAPSPLARGQEGDEWSARAPPAPPRRRRGSPCSASLAGREPEGARDAAQQTCSGCAPHGSAPRVAGAAAAAAAPRGCRGGERASPRRPAPQPGPRAQPRSRPGLASRHGFPPGAGARVLALPAGGRRVRREVSGPWGALSASFPTLISHGPQVPYPGRWRGRRGVSPCRSWATASPRREQSRRAAPSRDSQAEPELGDTAPRWGSESGETGGSSPTSWL